jgi:hypothetical protein
VSEGSVKLPFAGYSVVPPSRLGRFGVTGSLKMPTLNASAYEIVWDDSPKSAVRAKVRPQADKFAGGHRIRVPPVPIPNTEVKPDTADGTVWETVWESRSLPALL